MIKLLLLSACFAVILFSCDTHEKKISYLESRIDSLQQELANAYVPGFGEFMSGVQVHHAKLWFAGMNENWDLADFEINEIRELKDDIIKYETDRPESKMIPMLEPALDSVAQTVRHKNIADFRKSFVLLTTTCNNCHRAVNYPFNDVKIPDTPPFSNQIFEPGQNK